MPALGWGKKVPEAQLMRVGGWEVRRTLEIGLYFPLSPHPKLEKKILPHKKKLIEVSLL
jgi:hypothetical protein